MAGKEDKRKKVYLVNNKAVLVKNEEVLKETASISITSNISKERLKQMWKEVMHHERNMPGVMDAEFYRHQHQ